MKINVDFFKKAIGLIVAVLTIWIWLPIAMASLVYFCIDGLINPPPCKTCDSFGDCIGCEYLRKNRI